MLLDWTPRALARALILRDIDSDAERVSLKIVRNSFVREGLDEFGAKKKEIRTKSTLPRGKVEGKMEGRERKRAWRSARAVPIYTVDPHSTIMGDRPRRSRVGAVHIATGENLKLKLLLLELGPCHVRPRDCQSECEGVGEKSLGASF
jgi:hypothetical protein